MVDDEEINLKVVAQAFRGQFEVHTARDGDEAAELARRIQPDVIITDQRMPNMSGVDFLAIAEQECPHAVRVLLTGFTDYGSVVKAVNVAHVHHYAEKPFHTVDLVTVVNSLLHTRDLGREREELLARLTRTVQDLDRANLLLAENGTHLQKLVVERTQQLTRANEELLRANDLLRQLAVRDGLTGLFNHRYLVDYLGLEIARAERYERRFGVLFVDVDDFKRLNERYGHAIGDQVLITAARVMQANGLRRSDFAARYGGDEFCVVLPETDAPGALLKAERICDAIQGADWPNVVPGLAEPITASVGAVLYPDHGVTARDLLAAADAALRCAKSSRPAVTDEPGARPPETAS